MDQSALGLRARFRNAILLSILIPALGGCKEDQQGPSATPHSVPVASHGDTPTATETTPTTNTSAPRQSARKSARRRSPAISLDEGIAELERLANKGIQRFASIENQLKAVKDDAGLRRLISQFDAMSNGIQIVGGNSITIEVSLQDSARFDEERSRIGREVTEKLDEFRQRLATEVVRIKSEVNSGATSQLDHQVSFVMDHIARGNPPPFVHRVYPSNETLEIFVAGQASAKDKDLFKPYLRSTLDVSSIRTVSQAGQLSILVAPVADSQAVADELTIGQVSNITPENIEWALTDDELSGLRAAEDQKKADEDAEQVARREKRQRETEERYWTRIDQKYSELVEDLMRANDLNSLVKSMDDILRGGYRLGDLKAEFERSMQVAEIPINGRPGFAEVQTELERISQDRSMRIQLLRRLPEPTAEHLVRYDSRKAIGDLAENPDHPDFAIANVDVARASGRRKREALERLAAADPNSSPETRKYVARALRDIVLTSNDKEAAIPALVTWAGKHSVPILLKTLESRSVRDRRVVYEQLAKYPSAESAEAVAKQVSTSFPEPAFECLTSMGSVAEPAVIQLARSENDFVAVKAIRVLAAIGTSKSRPVLRQAARLRDDDVAEAARVAMQEILRRKRK